MTVQQDLEAFRELALEMQDTISATPEGEEPDTKDVYRILDTELAEIVGGNYIELAGLITVPLLDGQGHVIGAASTTNSQRGYSQGVVVQSTTEEIIPGQSITRHQICYWLWYASFISSEDTLHETTTGLRALGPIEDTVLTVPALTIAENNLFLPDVDDARALAIEQAINNGAINLDELQMAFTGTDDVPGFTGDSELEIAYYERYLSSLLPLSQMDVALITQGIIPEGSEGKIIPLEDDDELATMDSDSKLFLGFRYNPTIKQLCIEVDAGMNMKVAHVPLDEIVVLSIKNRS